MTIASNIGKAHLHPDRLFSADTNIRAVAREIYNSIQGLPIISPHGHTDPRWYAENKRFDNPAAFLVIPDHYVFRMLYSQGIELEELGIPSVDGTPVEQDPRKIWRLFAKNFHLYRGTPTKLWMTHSLSEVLGVDEPLCEASADRIYDHIEACLASDAFLPRTLFEKFNIEALATTEFAVDTLEHHKTINSSGWRGRVITTFRPDDITNPQHPLFQTNIKILGEQTGEETSRWTGYLEAIRKRRAFFKEMGATATDHGFPTAFTTILTETQCQNLLTKAIAGVCTPEEAELFRGHMLVENARMSCDDGLVMQIHVGCYRNHNPLIYKHFGQDKGCDIPTRIDFVNGFRPLLNEVGNNPNMTIIAFSLDESSYSREIAPLAGHYPALKIGPAWWFHDSPEGMKRYRRQITETAGFYNTVGFNDDTRAFLSIPARHDVARRVDSNFLAHYVCEHLLTLEEALDIAHDLTYTLPRKAYKLDTQVKTP
ncbi:glucuronate isomerase [Parendozoicomonas haliclonae]|uniref:Uronate isomerase n=1 Tax=Parendozoicomonas haliclonae TaxID=1960125 RepID=A0A1X7AGU3_9GAMM|nr:glucuronate isomerase [Parendozoicomonas haliclonae]SMA39547.1 Uronate isomerase [Parendozoicomonas haliclonae]